MKLRIALAAALAALPVATPAANAAVVYKLDSFYGSFSYTSEDFIKTPFSVPADQLSYCHVDGASCTSINFLSGYPYDVLDLLYKFGQDGEGIVGMPFPMGAFAKPGTYVVESDGTFSVSEIGGVPEPMTWMMMVVGAGLAGAAIRQNRKLRALPA